MSNDLKIRLRQPQMLRIALQPGNFLVTPEISIGTVTTLSPNQPASVVITGTVKQPVLNFGIPKGDPGNATIDDTAGSGATTKVWSADKAYGEIETVKDALENVETDYTRNDRTYPDLTSGNAEQLLSTTGVTDKVPYLFRQSAGDGADREMDMLVGGSMVWNALLDKENYPATFTQNGITFTNNGNGSVTANGTAEATVVFEFKAVPSAEFVSGHKYLIISGFQSNGSSSTYELMITLVLGSGSTFNLYTSGAVFISGTRNATKSVRFVIREGATVTNLKCTPFICDLTKMFGTTIADYIYSLEQANAGAGVAWFKKLFPKPYYAYDAGTLMHVQTSAHEMTGFNQFNKETANVGKVVSNYGALISRNWGAVSDYIRVIGGATYYASYVIGSGTLLTSAVYDADKNFIRTLNLSGRVVSGVLTMPSNAMFIRINMNLEYIDKVCFNLHWDDERDGEYEPYELHSYPLDDSLILCGIPKLDANNRLYYDGDTYEADGTVTRNYQQRAYQSGDESLADAVTDGTNTVVKLSTPTTETFDPYQTPQILDPYGTEAYIDTRDVPIPVGHETFYPENLRTKIEELPKDFSTLIAPKEKTFKATQPYASGALFIVNNVLYKATASIANGATITPGTNCTATTLAAVIAALA